MKLKPEVAAERAACAAYLRQAAKGWADDVAGRAARSALSAAAEIIASGEYAKRTLRCSYAPACGAWHPFVEVLPDDWHDWRRDSGPDGLVLCPKHKKKCRCGPAMIALGHREDCPLNEEFGRDR